MVDDRDRNANFNPVVLPLPEAGMSNDRVRTLRLLQRIAEVLDQPIDEFFKTRSGDISDAEGSGKA